MHMEGCGRKLGEDIEGGARGGGEPGESEKSGARCREELALSSGRAAAGGEFSVPVVGMMRFCVILALSWKLL